MSFISKVFKTLASPIIGAVGSFVGGERRNDAQVASAREQMAFQERMSNTAHRRQVADLRAAGINPILSAKLGGASAQPGAQANIQDTVTPAVNTGLQMAMNRAQVWSTQAQAQRTEAETDLITTRKEQIEADIDRMRAATGLTAMQRYKLQLTLDQALNRAQISRTEYGYLMDLINYGGSTAVGAAGGIAAGTALGAKKISQLVSKYGRSRGPLKSKGNPLFVPRHPLASQRRSP